MLSELKPTGPAMVLRTESPTSPVRPCPVTPSWGRNSSRWTPRRARASLTRARAIWRSRFSCSAIRISDWRVVSLKTVHQVRLAYDESRSAVEVSRQLTTGAEISIGRS